MIRRLPHPLRGIAAMLAVFLAGALLGGFGIGVLELIVLTVLASGAFALASTRTAGDRGTSP